MLSAGFWVLVAFTALGQTIITTSFSVSTVCQGANTNVNFTSVGPFNLGNIYTAQLSDASGSFATPVNLTPALTSSASGNLTITNVNIPLATPAGAGYYIRVVSSNPVVQTDPGRQITINPRPVPVIAGPTSVCLNSSGNIYTTETGMSGYSWGISGGTINSGNGTSTVSVTWTMAGARSINVNYNNTFGCRGASPTVYNVTVNANPSPPAAGNNFRCGAGSVTITATPSAGETIDWYDSPSAGVLLLSGNTSYSTPSISVTTTYYAEARNIAAGCVSATRTAVNATVNPAPAAPAAGNNSRCGPGTVTITATPAAGETIDWYDAASGGVALLSGNTSFTTPSILVTTVYYAEAGTAQPVVFLQPGHL